MVLTEKVIEHEGEIGRLWESSKSAHKRIDENDRVTEGIYKLASNMEALTIQVKSLAQQMETAIARIETGQKSQGERIGALEKEPAQKWKTLVAQVTGLVVAAVIGAIIANFIK